MQVGIGVNTKNYQSSLADNTQINNDLRNAVVSSNQNALCSSHDNESNQDAPSFSNLRNPSRPYQFNKSTSLGNLSFINVVGLPCHPRQTSVPSSTTSRNTNFPIHCRNVSEPNTTPVKTSQPVVPFDMSNSINMGTNLHLGGTSVRSTTYSEPCWNQSCSTSNNTDPRLSMPSSIGRKQGGEIKKSTTYSEQCWNQICNTSNNIDARLSTQSSICPKRGGEIVKGIIYSEPRWNQNCSTSNSAAPILSTQSSIGRRQGGEILKSTTYSGQCWNQNCSTTNNTDPRLSMQSSIAPNKVGEIVKSKTYSEPCWNQTCSASNNIDLRLDIQSSIIPDQVGEIANYTTYSKPCWNQACAPNNSDSRLNTQSIGPKQGVEIGKGTTYSEPCWIQTCSTSMKTDPRQTTQCSIGPKESGEKAKGTYSEQCWSQNCSSSNNTDSRLSSHNSIGSKQEGEIVNDNALVVPARNQSPLSSSTTVHQMTDNVSNVNVNFYRAVPMNIMTAVPSIQCLNNQTAKNVSNVQIMHLSGSNLDRNSNSAPRKTSLTSCQVTVQTEQPPTHLNSTSTLESVSSVYLPSRAISQRTFTSTEAQTDDSSLCYAELSNNKERKRRERRDRRHNRRSNPVHSRSVGENTMLNGNGNASTLPDILDSHLPPPYTTHPNTLQRNQIVSNMQPPPVRPITHLGMIPQPVLIPPPQILGGIVPPPPVAPNMIPHPRARTALQNSVSNSGVPHVSYPPPNVISGQIPLVQNVPENNPGFRFAVPVGQFGRDHFSEESPKSCCGVLTWKPGSLKWLIASVALVAVGCVLVGTALGTMRPAGKDHFTIALLMIGIGIVLVTISGVAWRLASQNTPSCRTMLGIGSLESVDVCTRRFVPRLPPTYGRPHHPYAAMMYPEFQYRPPPPTYQASMQEYRLRLLLIDRGNTPQIQAGVQNAVSPPPTYRSHSGSLIRDQTSARNETTWSEYSCPPSYRSQAQLGTIEDSISVHTRDPSLSVSERTNDNNVEVVNILRNPQEEVNLDGVELVSKTDQDTNQYKLILEDCGGSFENNDKEDNLVTIVQTDERSPVIVTVSGNSSTDNTSSSNKLPSEIQILAHL